MYVFSFSFIHEKELPNMTTRVVFLYQVLLGIASYTEYNLAIQSRSYRIEYFCYSDLRYVELNIFTIPGRLYGVENFYFPSRLCGVEYFYYSD